MIDTSYTSATVLKDAIVDLGVDPKSIMDDCQESVVVHMEIGIVTFRKQRNDTFAIDMQESIANSDVGKKMLSIANGGTGELDQHYAKRAVFKAIEMNHGHKLKSCESKNGKIHIRVSVR